MSVGDGAQMSDHEESGGLADQAPEAPVEATAGPVEVATPPAPPDPDMTWETEAAESSGANEDLLRGVPLRLWAELGRTRLPVGRAVGLASGSVVELDRSIDEPVELYVNGRAFATGSLLVSEDGDWAVRIDEIKPDLAQRAASATA